MKGYTIQVHYPEWVIFDDSGRIVGSYGSRAEAKRRRNILHGTEVAEASELSLIVTGIGTTGPRGEKARGWLCEVFDGHKCIDRREGKTAKEAKDNALAALGHADGARGSASRAAGLRRKIGSTAIRTSSITGLCRQRAARADVLKRRGPLCLECVRLTKMNAEKFDHAGPTTCAACVTRRGAR